MLETYRTHVAERAALGIPPLPLSAAQTAELIKLLQSPPSGEGPALVEPGFPNRAIHDELAGLKLKGRSKLFARFQRPSNHSR